MKSLKLVSLQIQSLKKTCRLVRGVLVNTYYWNFNLTVSHISISNTSTDNFY